jgi:hypothetical protein
VKPVYLFLDLPKTEGSLILSVAEFGMDRLVALLVETIVADDRTRLNLERYLRDEKRTADGPFSRAWVLGQRNQTRSSGEQREGLLGSEGFRFARLRDEPSEAPHELLDHPIHSDFEMKKRSIFKKKQPLIRSFFFERS